MNGGQNNTHGKISLLLYTVLMVNSLIYDFWL